MKNNKLVSIIIALLVCLTMVVSASAATEPDLSFALESTDSSVEAINANVVKTGDIITVSVNIEANKGFRVARPTVEFDSTKLKFVEAKNGIDNLSTFAEGEGKIRIVIGNVKDAINPSATTVIENVGKIVDLTFEVLAETDVETAVTLNITRGNVCDRNGKYEATVSGAELKLNVLAINHACADHETIEAGAVAPTCTEAGKKADKICAYCGKVVATGEEIPATGHTEDEGVIIKAPTCAEMGSREYTCSVCGNKRVDDKVPASGEHTYGDWTVTREATEEAEGEETRTCSVCSNKETRSIAKLTPAPQKSNTVLIVVIVVVVVLAGAGVAAYFVLKNKKK